MLIAKSELVKPIESQINNNGQAHPLAVLLYIFHKNAQRELH